MSETTTTDAPAAPTPPPPPSQKKVSAKKASSTPPKTEKKPAAKAASTKAAVAKEASKETGAKDASIADQIALNWPDGREITVDLSDALNEANTLFADLFTSTGLPETNTEGAQRAALDKIRQRSRAILTAFAQAMREGMQGDEGPAQVIGAMSGNAVSPMDREKAIVLKVALQNNVINRRAIAEIEGEVEIRVRQRSLVEQSLKGDSAKPSEPDTGDLLAKADEEPEAQADDSGEDATEGDDEAQASE